MLYTENCQIGKEIDKDTSKQNLYMSDVRVLDYDQLFQIIDRCNG